jgi:predicted nucleic acid-binding protein
MILVDTSVWISHLRDDLPSLRTLLLENLVLCHPFVIGELVLGHLKNRHEILDLLSDLPEAKAAEHEEVVRFVNHHQLTGQGLGWVDAHLLASAALSHAPLWSFDQALVRATKKIRLNFEPNS